jgi:sulfotransferase family protein
MLIAVAAENDRDRSKPAAVEAEGQAGRVARSGGLQRQRRRELRKREAETERLRAEAVALRVKLEKAERRVKNLTQRASRLEAHEKQSDRELDELRGAVQLAATERGLPAPATPVFFIVGQAKSGTSWLMRLLNAHPEILCQGEGRFFGRAYKRPDVKRMSSQTLQPSSLYRALMDANYLRAWIERSVWTRDRDTDEQLAEVMHVLTNHFLAIRAAAAGKRIVGDKTPFLGSSPVGEIAAIYPDAKVIHIIRDGRDVAVSAMHHLWKHGIDLGGGMDLRKEEARNRAAYRTDPAEYLRSGRSIFLPKRLARAAREWAQLVDETMRKGPEVLGRNYAEVRYEVLLEQPERELARLLSFLGAAGDDRTVDACVEEASFERWSKGRERGQEDSTHLMRKGISGDWRNVFNDVDRRRFKAQAGRMLIELGYERDANW